MYSFQSFLRNWQITEFQTQDLKRNTYCPTDTVRPLCSTAVSAHPPTAWSQSLLLHTPGAGGAGAGAAAKSCPALATLPTVACQAPLSMGLFRQEYWSGLPSPSPQESRRNFDSFDNSVGIKRYGETTLTTTYTPLSVNAVKQFSAGSLLVAPCSQLSCHMSTRSPTGSAASFSFLNELLCSLSTDTSAARPLPAHRASGTARFPSPTGSGLLGLLLGVPFSLWSHRHILLQFLPAGTGCS